MSLRSTPRYPSSQIPPLGVISPMANPSHGTKSSLALISAPRRTRAHPFSAHPLFLETAKTPNPSFSKGHDKCRGAAVIKKGGRPTAEKKKNPCVCLFLPLGRATCFLVTGRFMGVLTRRCCSHPDEVLSDPLLSRDLWFLGAA